MLLRINFNWTPKVPLNSLFIANKILADQTRRNSHTLNRALAIGVHST